MLLGCRRPGTTGQRRPADGFRFELETEAVAVLVVDLYLRLVVLPKKYLRPDGKTTPRAVGNIGTLTKLSSQCVLSRRGVQVRRQGLFGGGEPGRPRR